MHAALSLGALVLGIAAASDRRAPEGSFQIAYFRPGPELLRGPGALDRFFDAIRPAPPLREPLSGRAHGGARPRLASRQAALVRPTSTLERPRPGLLIPVPVETAAYHRTFKRLLAEPAKTDRYDPLILKYAGRYGLNPRLLKAIVAAESEFVRRARSRRGALGLMQLMGSTAQEMGVSGDLAEPEHNIRAGAAYLKHLFARAWKRYRLEPRLPLSQAPLWVTQKVIAAYNAGPRFLWRKGLFRETREYLRKVLLFMRSPVSLIRREPLAPGPALPPAGAAELGTP